MSLVEFRGWCSYREKYGCLHPGMRVDRASSRVGAALCNLLAKKKVFEPLDLSPYDRDDQDDEEVTIEQAFAALSAAARSKG